MNWRNWLVIGRDWLFDTRSAGRMDFGFLPQKPCQVLFYLFSLNSYVFDFNGTEAIKHKLNELQLAEAIAQCNAKPAIATLLAE